MMPIVNGLEQEFAGQVTVLRLDAAVAANLDLQARYGLRGHPSFVVLDEDGRMIQTFVGPQTAETLRQALVTSSQTPYYTKMPITTEFYTCINNPKGLSADFEI